MHFNFVRNQDFPDFQLKNVLSPEPSWSFLRMELLVEIRLKQMFNERGSVSGFFTDGGNFRIFNNPSEFEQLELD